MLGAVAIAVWMGGWGPATAAALFGFVATAFAIERPLGLLPTTGIHTLLGVFLYAGTCALIIGLGEAMRRTQDAHHRSQERFVRSQEAAIQGYALLRSLRDPHGDAVDFEFEYINPLGASLHKTAQDRVAGRRITSVMPGACAAGLLEVLGEVVRTGAPIDIELADSSTAPPLWRRYMVVKVEDGVAMSFSDITETKRLALELKQRAADLQRVNGIKSLFLATLSHELRNPLAPIRNGLALLKERVPEDLAEIGAMMERQMNMATRLIDDLLDASRIDRGKLDLRRETITVESFINAAIETAKPNIVAKCHQLIIQHAPETVYVDGDPTRLAQVVANLLNNAAKFTPANGRIVVSVRSKAGFATIRVRDSGIGIPAEELGTIFEMFVQLDSSRSQAAAGLGLGLALARNFIAMHGGEITAHSSGPGKGSEFRIRLPLTTPPARPSVEIAPARPDQTPRRILVVDDNIDAATSLSMLLEYRGHLVSTCFDGATAYESAAQTPPDVAFVDLNMPHPDGIELAKMIRKEPWGPGVKLIALTGMGQPADLERTRAAGFDVHLIKPVNPNDLFNAMTVLRHSSSRLATLRPEGIA
jgi:signal transduction histidine kinase/ActR/RegA family two-component response regulator